MITIFGSSTAYVSMPRYGKSYVHLLQESRQDVHSHCMNGYTIWHANYMIPRLLTERNSSNVIILHVGACEAMTMELKNFLVLSTYWLNFGEVDEWFRTYIVPKIYQASSDLLEGKKNFYSLLDSGEFSNLYARVLKHLEGYKVLCIGMSRPSNEVSDIRIEQAASFDLAIRLLCIPFPQVEYIEVCKLCEGEVVDSNHLTEQGHKLLYNEILRRIN